MVAWTGALLGFYLFLRKSNLVPDSMETFNGQEQFCRKDVNLLGHDKAMMIEIRWFKTIQHKQKILRLPVLPAENKAMCPVFWLHHMVNRIPAAPQDPVLALRVAGQIVSWSSNQLISRIRKWLLLIEEDPTIYNLLLALAKMSFNVHLSGRHERGDDKTSGRLGQCHLQKVCRHKHRQKV